MRDRIIWGGLGLVALSVAMYDFPAGIGVFGFGMLYLGLAWMGREERKP